MPATVTPSSPRASTTRGGALVGRTQHEQGQRRTDHPGGEHLFDRHRLAEHGIGVGDTVTTVLDHDLGQVLDAEPRLGQQSLGASAK